MIPVADRNDIEQALRKVLGPIHDFSVYDFTNQKPTVSYAMCMDSDGRTHSFTLEKQPDGWLLEEFEE